MCVGKNLHQELEAEASLRRTSQPGSDSAESEEEEEIASLLIRNHHSRSPTTSKGTKVVEGPPPEALLAPLKTSSEGTDVQPSSPSIMMLALKVVESSLTTGPIGGKALVAEVSLVQVSSSSSEGDDYEFGSEHAFHDAVSPCLWRKRRHQ